MTETQVVNQIIASGELDGNGAWAHKILHKAWLSCYKDEQEYEDFFSDFLVIWYKRRPKYDPKRSGLTTFMHLTAQSFVRSKLRSKKRRAHLRKVTDFTVDVAAYDRTEPRSVLLDCYDKSKSRSVESLAKAAGMCIFDCREELESIAEDVKRYNTRVISREGFYS
jgi:hypothetical protein